MSKIAVDVVLLPCEEVTTRAIEANRELLKQYPDKIVLDEKKCLPHISLDMGCVNSSDIAEIEEILVRIAGEYRLDPLVSVGIQVGTNSAGEKVSVLELKRTKSLQSLHEAVMNELQPWLSQDATSEMVLSRLPAGQSTLQWIRDYPEKSSFERFFPHITLGYGQLDDFAFPAKFAATGLALCHLGNHCTCRKILASAQLQK